MENNNNNKITDPDDHQDLEEAEEALSLSELPLHDHSDHQNQDMSIQQSSRSPYDQTPDQLFEFFSDFKAHESNMCSAEEIFFCGKLLPNFKQNSQSSSSSNTSIDEKKQIDFRRRSESLSELERSSVTRSSSSTKNRTMMRNCRSLDYRKLRQTSKQMVFSWPEMDRNSSVKSVTAKSDVSTRKLAKPWWSFLMFFGIVKFPAEMELGNIKNRQVRQNPSRLFPPIDADGNIQVDRSSEKGSWKLLRALSCKNHASVAVTKSVSLPQPPV